MRNCPITAYPTEEGKTPIMGVITLNVGHVQSLKIYESMRNRIPVPGLWALPVYYKDLIGRYWCYHRPHRYGLYNKEEGGAYRRTVQRFYTLQEWYDDTSMHSRRLAAALHAKLENTNALRY